jgi:hypothetical protein
MKARYNQFNSKRRFKELEDGDVETLKRLSERVGYGGNPEHKKNPGDFNLAPPTNPRMGKSLCDDAEIFTRRAALKLLKKGLEKGLVSDRFNGEWPKNVWSVTAEGKPMEAQLENPVLGTYHGYPMPESDPLASEVLQKWDERAD